MQWDGLLSLVLTTAIAASAALPMPQRHAEVQLNNRTSAVPASRSHLRLRQDASKEQPGHPRLAVLAKAAGRRSIKTKFLGKTTRTLTLDNASKTLDRAMSRVETDWLSLKTAYNKFTDQCVLQEEAANMRMRLQHTTNERLDQKRLETMEGHGKLKAEVDLGKKHVGDDLEGYQGALAQEENELLAYEKLVEMHKRQRLAIQHIIAAMEEKRKTITPAANDVENVDYIIGIFKGMWADINITEAHRDKDRAEEHARMKKLIGQMNKSLVDSEGAYTHARYDQFKAKIQVREMKSEMILREFLLEGEKRIELHMDKLCSNQAGLLQKMIMSREADLNKLRAIYQRVEINLDTMPVLENVEVITALAQASHPVPHASLLRSAVHTNGTAKVSQRTSYTSQECAHMRQNLAARIAAKEGEHGDAEIEAARLKFEVAAINQRELVGRHYMMNDLMAPFDKIASEWNGCKDTVEYGIDPTDAAKVDVDYAMSEVKIYIEMGGPKNEAEAVLKLMADMEIEMEDLTKQASSDYEAVKSLVTDDLMGVYPAVLYELGQMVHAVEIEKKDMIQKQGEKDAHLVRVAEEMHELHAEETQLDVDCSQYDH